MIMEAETGRWLSEGRGWEDRHLHGWLRKLLVVELFEVSPSDIIFLVNFKPLMDENEHQYQNILQPDLEMMHKQR